MRRLASLARWTTVAIAIAAVIDPPVPVPAYERPSVRVAGTSSDAVSRVAAAVADAGYAYDPSRPEALTIEVADRLDDVSPGRDTWLVDATPGAPNVRILAVDADTARLPGQALEFRVHVFGDGVKGKTTELRLEDGGIVTASATHEWTSDREDWRARFSYLPATSGAGRVRIVATGIDGETQTSDNGADAFVPPARGPVRVLVAEAAVTWPALFVRRALEGQSAFTVATLQRASKNAVTRSGTPPRTLTRDALAPFDVVLSGGPQALSAADVDVLRWFVEERGGAVVFVPDQRPSGPYVQLLGVSAFDERILETPVRIGGGLLASELSVPQTMPLAFTALGSDPQGQAVVFSVRRGEGGVILSGALDAWRYRGAGDEFAQFWRGLVAAQALSVAPPLRVSVTPSMTRPGGRVRISARLRDSELRESGAIVRTPDLQARAVGSAPEKEESLRLWPTAEPGVFTGEWRPSRGGRFDIAVSAGDRRGDAIVTVSEDVAVARSDAPEDFAMAARAAGSRSFRLEETAALAAALQNTYPRQRHVERRHVMRSPWWCLPFAALLCVEWAHRRTRGRR